MEWEEPHDCTLYCIQTDGNHMIASGSSHYGVVRLWDKRQSRCLQVRLRPTGSNRALIPRPGFKRRPSPVR